MRRFFHISQEQWEKDGCSQYGPVSEVLLPTRGTRKSAGNDIHSVTDFTLSPGETIKLPTGIRVVLEDDKFLAVVPRSGLGFKFRTMLWNTIGIIDADYCESDNEGHIWLKVINESDKILNIKKGDAICQGIVLKYYTMDDDDVTDTRNGGFGSTGR